MGADTEFRLITFIGIVYLYSYVTLATICDGSGSFKNDQQTTKSCASFGNKYSELQWAVCLPKRTVSEHGLKCEQSDMHLGNKNCWYPCQLSVYGKNEGRVHNLCACKHTEQNKVSKLNNNCFLYKHKKSVDCNWYDKCLRVYLEMELKCDVKITNSVVDKGMNLCNANRDFFEKVPMKNRHGLLEIQKCLQTPFSAFLFETNRTSCFDMTSKISQHAKICFETTMKDWICDIPNDWFGFGRYRAYHTMKSELEENIDENYIGIHDSKWFWDFRKLPCDMPVFNPIIKRFLFTVLDNNIEIETIRNFVFSLDKKFAWKERCIKYEYNVFHKPSAIHVIFLEISIFPLNRFDMFTKCNNNPDMNVEVERMLRDIRNDHVLNVLGIMYCKDGTDSCTEEVRHVTKGKEIRCKSIGGYCETKCSNIYSTSKQMCSSDRRCCIQHVDDTTCPSIGGECIENYKICKDGVIVHAKCGKQRHCCFKKYKGDDCSELGGKCISDTSICKQGSILPAVCPDKQRCCIASLYVQYINKNDCKNIPIISRESWGAKKSTEDLYIKKPVPYFIIHHSAGNNCAGLLSCSKILQEYQKDHMNNNGWRDIGYTFFIDDDGNVYQTTGWGIRGIHSNNFNPKSYAVSFFGDYTATTPTEKALTSLKKLEICGQNGQWLNTSFNYLGHRDVRPEFTECPGLQFYTTITKWERYSFLTDEDKACAREHGKCQDKTIYKNCINGTYYSKKCIGHVNRKCCVPDQE